MANTWTTTIENPGVGAVKGALHDTTLTYTPKTVELTYTYDKGNRVWTPAWAQVAVFVDTPGKSVRDVAGGTFDLTDVYTVPDWLYVLANRYRPAK